MCMHATVWQLADYNTRSWKHFRQRKHDHRPLSLAIVRLLLSMIDVHACKIVEGHVGRKPDTGVSLTRRAIGILYVSLTRRATS